MGLDLGEGLDLMTTTSMGFDMDSGLGLDLGIETTQNFNRNEDTIFSSSGGFAATWLNDYAGSSSATSALGPLLAPLLDSLDSSASPSSPQEPTMSLSMSSFELGVGVF